MIDKVTKSIKKYINEKFNKEIQVLYGGSVKSDSADFIEISAAGATLHAFYNGLENIFILIGKQIDNAIFTSQRWHKELLDSMFSDTDRRSAVLDNSLHDKLLDYMSFRHVFRHSYGYALDWERLNPLFSQMNEVWKNTKACIQKFIE